MTGWTPTDSFKHGTVVLPFLPLTKPNLARLADHYCNLYPGDNVYIFEENGTEWGRGYVITQANPSDFSSAVINLNKLISQKGRVAIIPLSHVRIYESLDFDKDVTNREISHIDGTAMDIPSFLDTEISVNTACNDYDVLLKLHRRPILPNLDKQDDIVDELKSAVMFLTSHIYAMYSMGEFHLFEKLTALYTELEDVRLLLSKKLCTVKEATYLRKKASSLLTNIPKYLAATEKLTQFDEEEKLKFASSDVSGYRAIMARNPNSGELLEYTSRQQSATPSDMAMNQILYALSGSYPLNDLEATLEPKSIGVLERSPPSNIMVDFESVSGSTKNVPKGYKGMTAYLYLRNKKKRLTEAFAIKVGSGEELLLENVSAALFKNIPPSQIDNNGKVYLVSVLVEDVDISYVGKDLKTIKKGIAAGVTDISRVFSRHKGALASGESHHFTIKLYGSFITPNDNESAPLGLRNNGWGELVDRIIQGSSVGIAVNPRAESLSVSVKEIKNKTLSNESFETSHETALTAIRTIAYDPLSELNEKVYIRMNKVVLADQKNSTKNSYLTIRITLANPNFNIAKGSNQEKSTRWECVSVIDDEVIGEVLSIGGLEKSVELSDEFAKFQIFANGELKGEGKFTIKKDYMVSDTNGADISLPLRDKLGKTYATLTSSAEYIGSIFNPDASIKTILNWKNPGKNLELATALKDIFKKGLPQLVRNFSDLLTSLFAIYEDAAFQSNVGLESLIFDALIHILDIVLGKQDQFIYMFEDFCNLHQNSTTAGYGLLARASQVLSDAETAWSHVGRQFCRISLFFFQLTISCNKDSHNPELATAISYTNSSLLQFLSLSDSKFLPEQIVVLDGLNYYFQVISRICSDAEIWQYASNLVTKLSIRGLGLKEEAESILSKSTKSSDLSLDRSLTLKPKADAVNAMIAKKKTEEHKLITYRLVLIRKLLHGKLIESSQRDSVISKVIDWSVEVLLSSYDTEASRLAIGNLVKCFEFVWQNIVMKNDKESWYLVRSISRLLPIFTKIFIKYNKYCKVQGHFKSKRTFTNFFQMEYPFVENTIDSIVAKETFVELLIELSTIICYITRFCKHCVDVEKGFDSIEITSKDEEFLRQSYYPTKLSDSNIISMIQYSKIIYDSQFFPSGKWLSLYAMLIESSFSVLEMLKSNMVRQFIPPSSKSEEFNTSLWGNYLRTILKMTTSKPAATCQLSEIPRNGCDKIVGDLRIRGANLMEEIWYELGWDAVGEDKKRFQLKKFTGYQSEFLSSDYSILRDLMLLFMQRNERCQIVGVNTFWTIIASECILNEDGLTELAREAITGLYDLFNSDGYKPDIREIRTLVKLLKMTIKVSPGDLAYQQISTFIQNLADFLFLLNDLSKVPYSDEFDDDRTFHKLQILGFLLNVNQPNLLYQFIDDMYQSSIASGNYVQAALSLDYLANTYDWSLHTLVPESSRPYFPQQTPFKRKEALYRMIGHNYAKGNALEQAVEVYSELRDAYDAVSLDLKGLAYVNSRLGKLYCELQNPDRIMPSYFRVCYIGHGFPSTLKGKGFIHQGLPFEQLSSVQDRLSRLYPGSRILTKESEFLSYTENVPIGKYLYINSVEPGKGFNAENSLVSYSARLYVQNKELKHFVSFKRLPNATGVQDLWSEEVIYETFQTFPALMNKSEIKETRLIKLSPLENSYRLIVTKNHDLANIESMIETAFKDKEDMSVFFGDLSRQLSGTVDSPVNGGIGQYRIFFTEKYFTQEYAEGVKKLRAAFNDLAIILNRCLGWHGKLLSTPKLKESHAELLRLFTLNFKPEIDELGLVVNDTSDSDASSLMIAGGDSLYSSDDDNSSISRTRTNLSYSSNGTSSEVSSSITKLPSNMESTLPSNASLKSSSSKGSNSGRIMRWRQGRF